MATTNRTFTIAEAHSVYRLVQNAEHGQLWYCTHAHTSVEPRSVCSRFTYKYHSFSLPTNTTRGKSNEHLNVQIDIVLINWLRATHAFHAALQQHIYRLLLLLL